MRTKDEINRSLSDSLNSSSWNEIKNSLLGKELISFGTAVIFDVESMMQSLKNPLFIDKANLKDRKSVV